MTDTPLVPVSPVHSERQQSEASLEALCQRYKAVILHRDPQIIRVACHESEADTESLSNVLRFATGLKVQLERWPQARLEQVMEKAIQGRNNLSRRKSSLLLYLVMRMNWMPKVMRQ